MRALKVVVTGGGTAGHVFTGISVLDEVRRRDPRADTVFLGGATGHETRLVPMSGHRFVAVDIRPLRLHGPLFRLGALIRIPGGVARCLQILRQVQPDVVMGIGGAASGPALIAARLLGIPTALHEQNSLPGLANRLAGRFVARILVGLPQRGGHFAGDSRVRVTGNPIRAELLETFARASLCRSPNGSADHPFAVVVLGGSDGSPFINHALPRTLKRVAEANGCHLLVRHQAGVADLAAISRAYAHPLVRAEVAPFFGNIGDVYRGTDLAITLGGALTLAELAHAGLPAVVVPFAAAADDHQRRNAEHHARHGAVVLLDEARWNEAHAVRLVAELLVDSARRARLGVAARALATPDASGRIVDALEALRDEWNSHSGPRSS